MCDVQYLLDGNQINAASTPSLRTYTKKNVKNQTHQHAQILGPRRHAETHDFVYTHSHRVQAAPQKHRGMFRAEKPATIENQTDRAHYTSGSHHRWYRHNSHVQRVDVGQEDSSAQLARHLIVNRTQAKDRRLCSAGNLFLTRLARPSSRPPPWGGPP